MSIFNSGFKGVEEEAQRQAENRANMGKQLFRLFIKAGDEDGALLRFLNKEPVTFYEHQIQKGKKWINKLCIGDGCPYCGDNNPTYKGAFLVYDYRKYKDKDGKTKESGLRLYVAGIKVLSQLMRLAKRYGKETSTGNKGDGLIRYFYQLDRDGSGTSTSYTLSREDACDALTSEELEAMFPEKLREEYDFSEGNIQDTFQDIIMEQLKMTLNSGNSKSDEDESLPFNEEDDDEDLDNGGFVEVDSGSKPKPKSKLGGLKNKLHAKLGK